jgi:phosphomannomutase/phosphoglucomutase
MATAAKEKSAKPVTKHSAQNTLIRIVVRGAALGLVTLLACFVYLILFYLPARNQDVAQTLATELAASQAQLVDAWVQQIDARLQGAANNKNLLEAFAVTPPDLRGVASDLQRQFPESSSVRLIALGPLGIANVDNSQAGLHNNIEADLLRRVSDGTATRPEAYAIDKVSVISFAQAVSAPGSKYAAGAILLTVPATYLEQLLASQLSTRAQVQLQQQAGSQWSKFAAAGSGDETANRVEQKLAAANWQLQLTPASTWLDRSRESPLILLLVLAASTIGILLGMLTSARDFRIALEQSLQALVGSHAPTLPGFTELRAQLQRKFASASVPKEATTTATTPAVTAVATIAEPQLAEEIDVLVQIPDTIFRAYDIRGIAAQQLTDEIVYQIALAIGSEALERGQQEIIIARDGRASSEAIAASLIRGLRDSGRNVVDIGLVPTPVLYFAAHQLDTQSGVMITGSHNAAEYNGLKIVLGGKTLSGRAIQALKQRIAERQFSRGKGSYRVDNINERYIEYILNDVAIAQPLKIVIDAGNGVTGTIAPQLFRELGCEVIPLYCDVDPKFPNHDPDPSIAKNLKDLVQLVRENGADLGIAFDGDGDRVGVVTATGDIVAADRLLMILAQDVVARNPGADILFDVKCSRSLNNVISSYGGRPIMWKSGHSFMKDKMAETGALLGGEFSGHIFFNERWFGFDDGMYAAARLIEILSTTNPDLDSHLDALPPTVATPELKIDIADEAKFALMEKLALEGRFGDGKLTTLDGLRIDFPDGWGLVRASNTTPALTLRFEADNEEALARIETLFRDQLLAIAPTLPISF